MPLQPGHRIGEFEIVSSLGAGGGDYQVVLSNGTRLGLSRLYRDALQQQLTSGV